MERLLLGLLIFLSLHSISIVAEGWRDRMVERIGEFPWKGLYSIVSIFGFVLIVSGYGLARQDPVFVYTSPQWLRITAMFLLLPVFPLLLTAYLPGRLRSVIEHPTLLATQIWAVAHLLANGKLADLVLFGSFLVWSVLDQLSMRTRVSRPIARAAASGRNDVISIVGGLAIYYAFVMWLHVRLIGMPIL